MSENSSPLKDLPIDDDLLVTTESEEDPYPHIDKTIPQNIKDYDDDDKFTSQVRTDYQDMFNFIKCKTKEDRLSFLSLISRKEVVLIREHMLLLWTTLPDYRKETLPHIIALNEIIYGLKPEDKDHFVEEDKKRVEEEKKKAEYESNIPWPSFISN